MDERLDGWSAGSLTGWLGVIIWLFAALAQFSLDRRGNGIRLCSFLVPHSSFAILGFLGVLRLWPRGFTLSLRALRRFCSVYNVHYIRLARYAVEE